MARSFVAATLIVLVVCLVPAAVSQQDEKKDEKKTEKKSEKKAEKGEAAGSRPVLPNYYKKLGLLDTQRAKILKVRADYQAKVKVLEKQLRKLKSEEREELEKLLTPDQLKRLRQWQTGEKVKE